MKCMAFKGNHLLKEKNEILQMYILYFKYIIPLDFFNAVLH